MKKLNLIIVALLFSTGIFAQSVGINSDGSAPDASAMLDVSSTSKGFLSPRIALTGSTDVTTIASPATGLLIYNTATVSDVTPGYYYYSGAAWMKIGAASDATQWTTTGSNIYYNTGYVGIGNASPQYSLDITANNGRIKLAGTTGYVTTDYVNNAGSFYVGRESSAGGSIINGSTAYAGILSVQAAYPLQLATNNAVRATITGTGNVGIGTTAPGVPLDVSGTTQISTTADYFHIGSNGIIQNTASTFNVTIRASNDVMAGGAFVATSDKRVKENITELHNSLDLIGRLRPVSYNKIDRVQYGNMLNYGFIAQEVEDVMPNAVNTGTGEVPILQPFDKVEFEEGVSYTLLVKNGDNIVEQKYSTTDPRPAGEIIVKSKTVDDFKSLTYNMIFTVAVDAIQEQQQLIEDLQKQNAILSEKANEFDELKAEVEKIKKAMATQSYATVNN